MGYYQHKNYFFLFPHTPYLFLTLLFPIPEKKAYILLDLNLPSKLFLLNSCDWNWNYSTWGEEKAESQFHIGFQIQEVYSERGWSPKEMVFELKYEECEFALKLKIS